MNRTRRLPPPADRPWLAALNHLLSILFALALVGTFLTASSVSTGDDGGMLNILRMGMPGGLIISYPLGWLLGQLYSLAPAVPFYSILLLGAVLLSYYNFIGSFDGETNTAFFFAANLTAASMFIRAAGSPSITLATMTLLITSLCALFTSSRRTAPWLGVVGAALLRPLWQVELLVLLSIAALATVQRYFERGSGHGRRVVAIAALILGVHFSPQVAPGAADYREWLDYNHWRAQVGDFKSVKPGYESSAATRDIQNWHFFEIPLGEIQKIAGRIDTSPRRVVTFFLDGGAWRYLRTHQDWVLPSALLWMALLVHRGPRLATILAFAISLAPLLLICSIRDRFRLSFGLTLLPLCSLALFRAQHALTEPRNGFGHVIRSALYVTCLVACVWLSGHWALSSYRHSQFAAETIRLHSESFESILSAPQYRSYNKIPSILIPFKYGFDGFHQFRLFHETTDLPNWFERRVVPAGWVTNHPIYRRWMKDLGYSGYCDMIRSETLYFGRQGGGTLVPGQSAVRDFIVRRCGVEAERVRFKPARLGPGQLILTVKLMEKDSAETSGGRLRDEGAAASADSATR